MTSHLRAIFCHAFSGERKKRRYALISTLLLTGVWGVALILPQTPPISAPKTINHRQGHFDHVHIFSRTFSPHPKMSQPSPIEIPFVPTLAVESYASQGIWACRQGTIILAASVGDPTPLGGTFSAFSGSVENQAGEIAFKATIMGGLVPEGIFLISDGRVEAIAGIGDKSPLGVITSFLSPPTLNNFGTVAFRVGAAEGEISQGILLASAGTLSAIAVDGEPSPLGGVFALAAADDLFLTLGNNNEVAFTSPVLNGRAPAGIFLIQRGIPPATVVAIDDASPVGGTFSSLGTLAINSAGEIVFSGTVTNGKASQGIFLASTNHITIALAEGDPTPVGGTFVFSPGPFSPFVLTSTFGIVFSVGISGNEKQREERFPSTGVFLLSDGQIQKIITDSDPMPQGVAFAGEVSLISADTDSLCFLSRIDENSDGDPDGERFFSWNNSLINTNATVVLPQL